MGLFSVLKYLFGRRTPQEQFYESVNGEIFYELFPHLTGERRASYPFSNDDEMETETEKLDIEALLRRVEEQAKELPDAYGKAFRYIVHRNLCDELRNYSAVANRRTHPKPTRQRPVAAHA